MVSVLNVSSSPTPETRPDTNFKENVTVTTYPSSTIERKFWWKICTHIADHLKTNSQDLLAFVKQSGQQLYEYGPGFRVSQNQVLESKFWKLMADFWVKLDAGHCPPLDERMLILQLQRFTNIKNSKTQSRGKIIVESDSMRLQIR